MVDILKMNLFRLKKTRLAVAMIIVAVGLSLLFFGLDWLMYELLGDIPDFVNMPPNAEAPGNNVWSIVRTALGYGGVPTGAAMGCIMFFMTDVTTGYVKNLVGYEADKRRLAGANLVTIAIYSAVVMVIVTVILLLLTMLGYKRLEFDGFTKFFVWWLISYVEIVAFVMLLTLLTDATGKGILFMILGGLYPIMAMSLYQLFDLIVQAIVSKVGENGLYEYHEITVEKYALLGGLTSYPLSHGWKELIIPAVIAAAVLTGVYFLDVLALKRREIK